MIKKMLVCVDSKDRSAGGAGADHNKFYEVSFDDVTGMIHYRYGRINQTSTSGSKPGTQSSFEKLVKSKIKKGYVEVDVHQTDDSSSLLRDKRISKALTTDPQVEALVNELVAINKHDLFEGRFDINMDANGAVRTAFGILTSKTIDKAEDLLTQIMNGDKSKIKDYFVLIPHFIPVGATLSSVVRDWDDEKEAFETLKQSVLDYEANMEKEKKTVVSDDDIQSLFSSKLEPVTDAELSSIKAFYEQGKKSEHYAASKMTITNAFAIKYSDDDQAKFDKTAQEIGNVQQLWHGTSAQNVLNILRAGLFCPDEKDKVYGITGRMFGNGVYLSDQSTKALNYARGFWGQKNNSNKSFMFLTDTAMGRTYTPNDKKVYREDVPTKARAGGFQSISVKAGTYVQNNEMIVWNTDQIQLKYLVVFE